MMYGNGWYGGADWFLMAMMMLVFWTAVAALVVWLWRQRPSEANDTNQYRSTPEDLLAERLAKGELTEEQYRAQLQLIRQRHDK